MNNEIERRIFIYLASGYENKFMLLYFIENLQQFLSSEDIPYYIHHDWIKEEKNYTFGSDIKRDLNQIDLSDILISFYPWGTGTNCEISYALGKDKYIISAIPKQFCPIFNSDDINIYSKYFPLSRFKIWKLNKYIDNYKHVIVTNPLELYEALSFFSKLIKDKKE
jgi:hypothetical protein